MSENECNIVPGEMPDGIEALFGDIEELDEKILLEIAGGKTHEEIGRMVCRDPHTISNRTYALTVIFRNRGFDLDARAIASYFQQLSERAIMEE